MRLPVTTEQFLAEYWQQKPLLCPQALPNFQSPISAEELAGLAMEPDIDSRMVWQDSGVWHQQTGPFAENAFRGEMPWTLLVQGVDRYHPGVSALRNTLPPLPRWRFDDVMVSFATDQAGVGPHFDRYDVFLLQGVGRREWRIGPHCDDETPQLQENGLNLIPPFEAVETYVLEPGDALYVPPGIAHWGVALGEAITYSLGFRAPSVGDLMARRTDEILERISTTSLLEDGGSLNGPSRPGEITAEHIANARDAINNALDALDSGRWFGEVVTEVGEDLDNTHLPAALQADQVRLHPAIRIAWREREDRIDVFINGSHFEAPLNALEHLMALCNGGWVQRRELAEATETLFETLCETGALTDEDLT